MKSLNGFRKLTFICCSLILTGFAVACIYSDLILNTTSFMEFSEVKFKKRLDNNYERFVASKNYLPTNLITKKFVANKKNKMPKITKPALTPETKSDSVNNEEKYEILTASFSTLQIRPVNQDLKEAVIDPISSEISVKIINNQITEIISLSIVFDNSVHYEITSSIPVNPLSGQFSTPSSTGSNHNDGGFVNFDNNTYTLNVRFFTGILQDSLIVFKNHQSEQEVADNNEINHNTNPDDAYNKIMAEDEAEAIQAAQPTPQLPQLAFQSKEDAIQHRMSAAQRANQDQDIENEEVNDESKQPELEMNAVDPEHAEGFSFDSNNERI